MDKNPGAPLGNTNALRHGGRSSRPGTVLTRLGARHASPYQDALKIRHEVEMQLRQSHGKLNFLQAAKIQTVCRLELSIRVIEQAIRETPGMPAEELRTSRGLITQWSTSRDNLLDKLLSEPPKLRQVAPEAREAGPAADGGPEGPGRDEGCSEGQASLDAAPQNAADAWAKFDAMRCREPAPGNAARSMAAMTSLAPSHPGSIKSDGVGSCDGQGAPEGV